MREHNGTVIEQVDIQVQGNAGASVFLFHPLTDEGRDWLEQHLPEEAPMLGRAYAVEHRYALDIAAGALNDGLVVR